MRNSWINSGVPRKNHTYAEAKALTSLKRASRISPRMVPSTSPSEMEMTVRIRVIQAPRVIAGSDCTTKFQSKPTPRCLLSARPRPAKKTGPRTRPAAAPTTVSLPIAEPTVVNFVVRAVGLHLREREVDGPQQIRVAFPNRNAVILNRKRRSDHFHLAGIGPHFLEGHQLVEDHRVGPPELQRQNGFRRQRVVLHDGTLDAFRGEVARRADLDRYPLALQIRRLLNPVVVGPHQDDLPRREVRIEEVHGLGAFVGDGHGRDDDVVVAAEQAGDNAFPSDVDNLHVHAEAAAALAYDVHVKTYVLA